MLNAHGSAKFWLIFIVTFLIAATAGTWYNLNNGWSGSFSDTWGKLMAVVPGGSPVEDDGIIPEKAVERPPFLGPEKTEPLGEVAPPQTPPAGTPAPAPEQPQVPEVGSVAAPSAGELGAPEAVLKACVEKLKADDLIGAEQYVSERGMQFAYRDTKGIHEVLWKGLYRLHSFDEIGYNETKIAGQTAWIPLYTRLGNTRMRTMLVMANRGDGWKLDRLSDSSKF